MGGEDRQFGRPTRRPPSRSTVATRRLEPRRLAPCAVWPVAQSPKNNVSPCHHSQHNQSPERTTAIPPARIAVLIQARSNKEATAHNTQEEVKDGAAASQLRGSTCTIQKKHRTHSDETGMSRCNNIPEIRAHRGKDQRPQSHGETK